METTLRNADLNQLVTLLREQQAAKYDVVVSADRLAYDDGGLVINDPDNAEITLEGVASRPVRLDPTDLFEDGVADRLVIPRAYLRKLRESAQRVEIDGLATPPDYRSSAALLDLNVNGWLQADPFRKFLVRGFRGADGSGLARALLSDRFAGYDHLDALFAALDGVRQAGVEINVHSGNLTERSMRLTAYSPQLTALAPSLLRNYRSPWDGRDFDQGGRRPGAVGNALGAPGHEYNPKVLGGFDFRNSETGGAALVVQPWLLVEICSNGLTRPLAQWRKVHVGSRLDEGVVTWSVDTQRKNLELVVAQVRDAVSTFLDPTYLARWVDEIETLSGAPVSDPVSTIEHVGRQFGFSEGEQASILDCFIKSGDITAGGVMQAVTAAAQLAETHDRQAAMEDQAMNVLASVAN
jgi:hypothetical protein